MTNNNCWAEMDDPDPDEGSQGINASGQVHLAEISAIYWPVNAGLRKMKGSSSLHSCQRKVLNQAMMQWL